MLSIPRIQPSESDGRNLQQAFLITLAFVGMLWAIRCLESWLGLNLAWLGVRPGVSSGLIGVVTAPLLHGSFQHLVTNTPPLLVLGTALLFGYRRSWWIVLPLVWLGSGLGVWFTGREAFHFGASGLTHGLLFFIFIAGVLRRDQRAIVLAMMVFFLYGGMVWGIFPHDPAISFESHFWGAVMGALAAVLLRKRDPAPPVKRYEWEDEDEVTAHPIAGETRAQRVDETSSTPSR